MSGVEENGDAPSPSEAIHRKAIKAIKEVNTIEERVFELESTIEDQQSRIADQQAVIEELLRRTDTLRLIENGTADALDAKTRRAILLQYLRRKAEKRRESDLTSIDSDEWATVLQYPDLDRTTLVQDLRRTAEYVEWDGLEYSDGVLRADFSEPLPSGVVTEPIPEGFL